MPRTSRLLSAVSFLPLARSSATLDYFHTVTREPITDGVTEVVAMDLGKKEELIRSVHKFMRP